MLRNDQLGQIKSAKGAASTVARENGAAEKSLSPSNADIFLSDLVISFKNPAFSEENEWRLVRVIPDTETAEEISFREVDSTLVPYRATCIFDVSNEDRGEQDANKLSFPLKEIVFGPTLDRTATLRAISLLIQHEATSDHPITMKGYENVRTSATVLR